jgi:hypothetical protein
MFAAMNAFQEYVLEGRSRASYMTRWEANTGMIWLTRLGNKLKNMKMPNIWFVRPRCVLSPFKNDRPVKRD